jgi:predicted transcriptional regulator of viral defense system
MSNTSTDQVLALARERQIIGPRDLAAKGLPRDYLRRLVAVGKLSRIGRGLYSLATASPTEHHSLAIVAKQVPSGVICLLTALRFHDLTTQQPGEVWLAIASKAWRPRVDSVAVHISHFGGRSLKAGVTEYQIEGVPVKVFNAAKTVADCFAHRRTVGLDVAIEALREALRSRRATVDEIEQYAQICRVSRIVRPYLEALAR